MKILYTIFFENSNYSKVDNFYLEYIKIYKKNICNKNINIIILKTIKSS